MIIYDLDGTVIDSSHRKLARPDGTLDLDHWRENCTPEKIRCDKLLPLARIMKRQILNGVNITICTSRVMSTADFAFLELHGLLTRVILHRGRNDRRNDGEYKIAKLFGYFSRRDLKGAVMFDDAPEVRASLRPLGISVIDPAPLNERKMK